MSTDASSFAQQVAEFSAAAAGTIPPDALAAFAADQAAAEAAGVPPGVATPGSALPDAELFDAHGDPTSLSAQRRGRPAVVVFYRGAWCPYCNLALRTYQAQLLPALTARGVELIAISPQAPDGSMTTQEANALSFTVLSDPGSTVASALGVLTAPIEEARAAQRRLGLDLREINADGTYGLPMPTVLVVDADGTIVWLDVHPNYTSRTEVPAILAAVERLG